MNRTLVDLSHYSYKCGQVGRNQLLTRLPVIAGDSLDITLDGVLRLAQYRREQQSEFQVDICVFYQPYRHVYGNDTWIPFVRAGNDESTTFTGVPIDAGARFAPFLCMNATPASIRRDIIYGYNDIWNRYYKMPTDPDVARDLYPGVPANADTSDWRHLNFGRLATRLPHPMNGGTDLDASGITDLTDDDAEVPVTTVLDIRDLAQVQALYRSESQVAWFDTRYNDLMASRWGSEINTDADQRPTLIWHHKFMASGHEVEGRDDATLGSVVGRTAIPINLNIPRKYFPEHGQLWIFALVRFPWVHVHEMHPFDQLVNPTAQEWLADPAIWEGQPPQQYDMSTYLASQIGTPIPVCQLLQTGRRPLQLLSYQLRADPGCQKPIDFLDHFGSSHPLIHAGTPH